MRDDTFPEFTHADRDKMDSQMEGVYQNFGVVAALMLLLNIALSVGGILFVFFLIYILAAAAGVVPAHDVVPLVPYL